ncbi:hypothetical protein BJF90_38360 [Pseudonocardia sp. CNS-004]|nr:hypothetical protein BJF90_38360 [Pseudonocardia sp. CNS-004]
MGDRSSRRRGFAAVVASVVGAGVLAGCSGGSASSADVLPACSSLDGQTVSLVVPYEPGGGYDSYARLLAPYLEGETGATVAVQNQPGAGGLLALNNLLTESPDGTTIAIMNGVGAGGSSLAGADGAQFGLADFTYIGRVVSEPPLIVTSASGPYQTFDAVRAAQGFRWGSTGPGAEDYVTASLLNAVFGVDAQIVTGFPAPARRSSRSCRAPSTACPATPVAAARRSRRARRRPSCAWAKRHRRGCAPRCRGSGTCR